MYPTANRAKKNYVQNTHKMAQLNTHYIGNTFSFKYSPIQRSLAISIDSACFYYPGINQSIVYTHYIGLSLIGFLPLLIRLFWPLYMELISSQLWRRSVQ
jgi:hypothetical protein